MNPTATALFAVTLFAAALPSLAVAAADSDTLAGDAIAHKDITYAQRPSGPVKLDLFLPAGKTNVPLVLWIHGGGWAMGSKSDWSHMNFLTSQGYAVANIEYRFTQVAPFPAQLDDCLAAVDWLSAHAADYGIDASRIAVTGESAGGHLASLVGMARSANAAPQPGKARVKAVIDLFGPADLLASGHTPKLLPHLEPLLGGPFTTHEDVAKAASPIAHVAKDNPPFLIFHGAVDPLVPIAQSESFAEALKKEGVDVTYEAVPKAGHAGPEFWTTVQRDKMTAFLSRTLK